VNQQHHQSTKSLKPINTSTAITSFQEQKHFHWFKYQTDKCHLCNVTETTGHISSNCIIATKLEETLINEINK
jgi:hypothetical protein